MKAEDNTVKSLTIVIIQSPIVLRETFSFGKITTFKA